MDQAKWKALLETGEVLRGQGQLDTAVGQYEEIFRHAARTIARIRVAQNYWDLALPYLEVAGRDLTDFHVQYLLARAYRLHRRFEDALLPMQRAFRGMSLEDRRRVLAEPEALEALAAISDDVGRRLGRFPECIELYQLALAAVPDNPALLNNLAVAYSFVGQFEEASKILIRLVLLDQGNFLARVNLAMCYVRMDRRDEAIDELEQCDRLGFDGSEVLGGMLEQKSVVCNWNNLTDLRDRVARALDDPDKSQHVALTTLQAHFDDVAQMCQWTRRIAARAYTVDDVQPFNCTSVGVKRERIRVGYYSPHFYDNPVAHLTAALYELHDRSNFEIFVYAYGPDDGHAVRSRIANNVEHFLNLQEKTVLQMAEQIRKDEIEILVDLSANLGWAKPKTLVYRAAPVQVNWLGFIGTMGVPYYDYLIADNYAIPDDFDEFYSEKIVRLPHTFQITDCRRAAVNSGATRIQYGLPENAFVFSNCGMPFKIQPEQFDLWIEIIKNVPNSVLWLLKGHPSAELNLREKWQIAGLAQERLIISPRVSADEHVERISLADLFIDTYPCGSGATANDVLWAGLPLLALAGTTMVSRMAGSLLHAIGLPELIANNSQEYRDKAIYYGTHPVELGSIRRRLQANKSTWPLFDTKRFVRNLESGYRQMAARARAGLPPATITVLEEPR